MSPLLDLQVEIATRPPDTSPETGAPITLRCEALKLKYSEGMFSYPLTKTEQEDLRWYLEDYWKWPFEGFAQRGAIVEQWLPMLGQRLYQAAFREDEARNLIQQWQANTSGTHQISIVTTDAGFLSLPWELLHDGHDFLALQADPPISIVRRIAEMQQPSPLLPETTFKKPLRILLITSRPVDEGQVDARIIAREVVEVLQEERETGAIELEFLRPPTFDELITRLSKKDRPVHVLHFDGHGVFYRFPGNQNGNDEERGRLFFEKPNGKGDPVDAASLAEMLRYGDVPLAVLNACQSAAIGERDISSSVAVQLLNGGLQAVVAMSASVLATSAALYVKAFYGTLAAGSSIQAAHERAQRALREQPERHALQRRLDEAGKPVSLQDWWLPYLYLQHPLELRPTSVSSDIELQRTPSSVRLRKSTSDEPRYGFKGRARELLIIERWLIRGKLVVIHGFGGIGKTALAREAADWLTRTGMYQGACFVSFEGGRCNANGLLSQLGFFLGIYDGTYTPDDSKKAMQQMQAVLTKQRALVIADNLESILPGGEAELSASERTELWDVLLDLQQLGAGVLLTTRTTDFEDGRMAEGAQVVHLPLEGLYSEDAYTLATKLLADLDIPRTRAPYADLHGLLAQLDFHPLSIQLVLPALKTIPLATIRADFDALLPNFTDDTETGRNRSLLASLEYSLQRLSEEERAMLPRLSLFEGGANENEILKITEIPEGEWMKLRQRLEQAALVTAEQAHEEVTPPFLRFHPVLAPYLRSQRGADDAALRQRYAQHYRILVGALKNEDKRNPLPVRSLVLKELPNLRRTLELLLETGDLDAASGTANSIIWFLNHFGLLRECDELRRRINETAAKGAPKVGELTRAEWLRESDLGEDEFRRGNIRAAYTRFSNLLARIEALPEGTPLGRGSYEHCQMLHILGRYLSAAKQPDAAEQRLREGLNVINALIKQQPENQEYIRQRGGLLIELGDALSYQGKYIQAREAYENAFRAFEQQRDLRSQTAVLGQLGALALNQRDYAGAQARYLLVLERSRALNEPAMEAVAWHHLGIVAQGQGDWVEAERCYREELAISERLGDLASAATGCNALAIVADGTGRPAEAEGWYKRALEMDEQMQLGSPGAANNLNNLAGLLVKEVRAGHAATTRLAEAKQYAERALAIREKLDISSEIWRTLSILASIADLEGRAEEAREYHRSGRETYAAFEGNRYHIDRLHGRLIAEIVVAAKGLTQARTKVEAELPGYEKHGWKIADATRRIWAGERDWHSLAEGIDLNSALFVRRVLETIEALAQEAKPSALPVAIREASMSNDYAAFERAMEELSPEEQVRVIEGLLQGQAEVGEDEGSVDKENEHEEEAEGPDMDDVVLQLEPMLRASAAVALGAQDTVLRSKIEADLSTLEEQGWHLRDAVQRIWAGEHDAATLTAGLDEQDSVLVRRVLEIIAHPEVAFTEPTLEEVFAAMPEAIREALISNDETAFEQAIGELSPEEQQAVVEALQFLQGQEGEDENEGEEGAEG